MTITNRSPILVADDVLVAAALGQHYSTHGLAPNGGADDAWFRIRLGRVSLRLPNPPARRRALVFHDVNHIATGYNTTFSQGEVAIAAFEIGAGCGPFPIVWAINLYGLGCGLFCAPRAIAIAYARGRRSTSIYRQALPRHVLLQMTVGAVRHGLCITAEDGAPRGSDYLSFGLWSAASLALLGLSVIIPASLVWLTFRFLAA